ncbi:hypothetical protein [Streptomyces sp. NPDC050121]|uniref:hypothetical protein n=1 Tax=Streptomyces sp. NPDC050121 TaxID=3365601 RepID=UPI0037A6F085
MATREAERGPRRPSAGGARRTAAVAAAVTPAAAAGVFALVGAAATYLAVEDGATWLESALARRTADPLPVKVVRLPKSFLSGQSSALARYVSGGAALPAHQRLPAHLALVARYGADWYRTAGTRPSPAASCARSMCRAVNPGS